MVICECVCQEWLKNALKLELILYVCACACRGFFYWISRDISQSYETQTVFSNTEISSNCQKYSKCPYRSPGLISA